MLAHRFSPVLPLLTLLLGCLTPSAPAEPPREALFRYLPQDIGFCLVVQNLRGHWAGLADSPFAQRWSTSATWKHLQKSQEWEKLSQSIEQLCKHLDVEWPTLRDEIFGDCVAFAYRPGPLDKPEDEQGLVLLRARDDKLLAALVRKLNTPRRIGLKPIEVDSVEHLGTTYQRRTEGKSSSYYLCQGSILLFTAQEAMLKRAIEQARQPRTTSALTRRFRESHLDRAFVALLINPRAWDSAFLNRGDSPAARLASAHWKAFEHADFSLNLDREVRLALTLQARFADLPRSTRTWLATAATASDLWSKVTEETLLAVGNRLHLSALVQFLGEWMPPQARDALHTELNRNLGAALGKDVTRELLPSLGPDWGLLVSPPPATTKEFLPRATLALKIAPGEAEDPIDEAVLSALHSTAQVFVLNHNHSHRDAPLALRARLQDRVRIRYLDGDAALPTGLRPAFALRNGYLVLSTSPDEIVRFRTTQANLPSTNVPLLRVSLKGWRTYLHDHRDALAAFLARKQADDRPSVRERLDDIRTVLDFFDLLDLSQRVSTDQVSFTLRLVPALSLRR